MSDENQNNDPREAAADPPSEHLTPGGQPGDHEQPAQHASQVDRSGEGAPGDISGYSSVVEDPSQSEADNSHVSGRDQK